MTDVLLFHHAQHLFTDSSLPAYHEGAATLLKQRVLNFLDDIG